jgi:protein-S-isoprenylcysteine O-methyltransferase Ste14
MDKVHFLLQEIFLIDLSRPYWEIDKKIWPRSAVTHACVVFGVCKVFCDFMAQMYAFWLALLIKQVIKDPIHKLKGKIILYHIITVVVSLVMTASIMASHEFGVEVTDNTFQIYLSYNNVK